MMPACDPHIIRQFSREAEVGKRRALRGIAADAAASFVSRNNDFDGYWAIGRLHLHAREHSTTKILIDLSGDLSASLSRFASITARYRSMIETQAASKGLGIHRAHIELEFDLPVNMLGGTQCVADETGFICSLTIVDDRGGTWAHKIPGCCRPHDPKRESRSTRDEV